MIKKLFLIVLLLFVVFACSLYKQDGSKLFESVKGNNYKEIDEFVKKGGNINIKNEKGETVLWDAVRSNDVEMVRHLISKGADVVTKRKNGRSLIENFIRFGWFLNDGFQIKEDVAKEIVMNIDDLNAAFEGYSPLCRLDRDVPLSIIKIIVEKGADVNADCGTGADKIPVLSVMVKFQTPEVIKYIIDQGADVNKVDELGCTPLIWALLDFPSTDETVEKVKYLIEKGADVNLRHEECESPMQKARITALGESGEKIIKMLKEAGAEE